MFKKNFIDNCAEYGIVYWHLPLIEGQKLPIKLQGKNSYRYLFETKRIIHDYCTFRIVITVFTTGTVVLSGVGTVDSNFEVNSTMSNTWLYTKYHV